MSSKEISEEIIKILNEKKAGNVSAIHVADKTTLAEYFVMASANTITHVRSLANEVKFKLEEEHQLSPIGVEGIESGRWVVLDYNSVIVHLMHREERDFYQLDNYWEKKEAEEISPQDKFHEDNLSNL